MDLKHLNQQIIDAQVKAEEKRKQASAQRENAMKMYGANDARRQFMQSEADKLEDDARILDDDLRKLQDERTQKQQRLDQLLKDRDSVLARHQQELDALNKEIIELSGETTLTV